MFVQSRDMPKIQICVGVVRMCVTPHCNTWGTHDLSTVSSLGFQLSLKVGYLLFFTATLTSTPVKVYKNTFDSVADASSRLT